jgi:hypothetical protein
VEGRLASINWNSLPENLMILILIKMAFNMILTLAGLLLLIGARTMMAIPVSSDNSATITGVVLFSAANILTISVPNDGSLYIISDLVSSPTLSVDAVDRLNYNAIRLLNDERCFLQGQETDIVLGGGLPTSGAISPPQPIVAVSCG